MFAQAIDHVLVVRAQRLPAVEDGRILRGDKLGGNGGDVDIAPSVWICLVFPLDVAHRGLHMQAFLQLEERFHVGDRALVRATHARHRRLLVRVTQNANDVPVAFHGVGNVVRLGEDAVDQLVEHRFEQLLRTHGAYRHHTTVDSHARVHHRVFDERLRLFFVVLRLVHLPLDDLLRTGR